MILHTLDATGDWLPAASPAALCAGAEAVGQLARFRLNLLRGDWWEDPDLGCDSLERMRSAPRSDAALERLASSLTASIAETPEVLSVRDVSISRGPDGRTAAYSCRLLTPYGETELAFEAEL